MQYKIPQNVRIEDKIVGPLTLKQLISLGIGGGITYAIYIGMAKDFIFIAWFIPTFLSGAITVLFTFVKIRGLSFTKWIFLMAEYLKNPKKRVFMMGAGDFHEQIFKKKEVKKGQSKEDVQKTKYERDKEQLKKIAQISKSLDNYGKSPTP